MESYLFYGMEAEPDSLIVEGYHKPGSLTVASGAWIHAAGRAMLEEGEHRLIPHEQYVWLTVENGSADLTWKDQRLTLQSSDTCIIPVGNEEAVLTVSGDTMVLWMSFEGPLAATVVRKMGALLHIPLTQHVLPSQIYVAQQIVQVISRHSGTSHATYQLQHLMYGMLASQWGQPVAIDAMLSHEIAKVVDVLRAGQYKDNYSLAQMAAISHMPMETFRKRFVSEVGMPPLSYVLHCKMERAKELLRDQNYSVREAGAEVGMKDPYHFSKQFKNIVGISPSTFMKQAQDPSKAPVKKRRARKGTSI
ncbi:MAG: helix-turn-helix transcriptional regulator [Clostridia bacterium]|nr:helix-turn-helix transcriptional regulator [Clostridia bacterium]